MKALTSVTNDQDRRGLSGWRIIWVSTIICYLLYGAYDGNLGYPWGALLGIFIALVIYGRWWLVHDTRWFTYAQTCWQGSIVLTLVHIFIIGHNLATIAELTPIVVEAAACILGWVVMLYQPRPKRLPW